jgi:hypothetical protein
MSCHKEKEEQQTNDNRQKFISMLPLTPYMFKSTLSDYPQGINLINGDTLLGGAFECNSPLTLYHINDNTLTIITPCKTYNYTLSFGVDSTKIINLGLAPSKWIKFDYVSLKFSGDTGCVIYNTVK